MQVLLEGREQQAELCAARLDMEPSLLRLADEARDQAAAASGPDAHALAFHVENS